jgi:hypothetical protein
MKDRCAGRHHTRGDTRRPGGSQLGGRRPRRTGLGAAVRTAGRARLLRAREPARNGTGRVGGDRAVQGSALHLLLRLPRDRRGDRPGHRPINDALAPIGIHLSRPPMSPTAIFAALLARGDDRPRAARCEKGNMVLRMIVGLVLTVVALGIASRRLWWLKRLAFAGQPAPERVAAVRQHPGREKPVRWARGFWVPHRPPWTLPPPSRPGCRPHRAPMWGCRSPPQIPPATVRLGPHIANYTLQSLGLAITRRRLLNSGPVVLSRQRTGEFLVADHVDLPESAASDQAIPSRMSCSLTSTSPKPNRAMIRSSTSAPPPITSTRPG